VGSEIVGAGDGGREMAGGWARSGAWVHACGKPLADWDGPRAQIGTGLH
jgi:hypothetical protein